MEMPMFFMTPIIQTLTKERLMQPILRKMTNQNTKRKMENTSL